MTLLHRMGDRSAGWLVVAFPLAVLLAVLRLKGVSAEPFQITAHVYTGMLLGAWLASRRSVWLWLAVALIAVETVAFVITRRHV